MQLSPRAKTLLTALIERYITDGTPVGSRTLAKMTGLELSPATIRNVMADLEDMGLLHSPHTSAGRIPTEMAYRLFVDSILHANLATNRDAMASYMEQIEEAMSQEQDPQHLVESTSRLLSEVTSLAGIVAIPKKGEQSAFKQIEFVALSEQRILVILVTDDGTVQNRIISAARSYSPSELVQAANYFNDTFAGISLSQVKQRLVEEMQQTKDQMNNVMTMAVIMAQRLFEDGETSDESLVVSGSSNLMSMPDLNDVNKLKRLFEAFNAKRDLMHLLDQTVHAGGVKIFIGSESGYETLEDCSVVSAPYSVSGQIVGILGVVGPTRMPYEFVIPIVDVTAKLISSVLTEKNS